MKALEIIKLAKTAEPALTFKEYQKATGQLRTRGVAVPPLLTAGGGGLAGAGIGALLGVLSKGKYKSLVKAGTEKGLAKLMSGYAPGMRALVGATTGALAGGIAGIPLGIAGGVRGERKGLKTLHKKYPELKGHKPGASVVFDPYGTGGAPYLSAKRHIKKVRAGKK